MDINVVLTADQSNEHHEAEKEDKKPVVEVTQFKDNILVGDDKYEKEENNSKLHCAITSVGVTGSLQNIDNVIASSVIMPATAAKEYVTKNDFFPINDMNIVLSKNDLVEHIGICEEVVQNNSLSLHAGESLSVDVSPAEHIHSASLLADNGANDHLCKSPVDDLVTEAHVLSNTPEDEIGSHAHMYSKSDPNANLHLEVKFHHRHNIVGSEEQNVTDEEEESVQAEESSKEAKTWMVSSDDKLVNRTPVNTSVQSILSKCIQDPEECNKKNVVSISNFTKSSKNNSSPDVVSHSDHMYCKSPTTDHQFANIDSCTDTKVMSAGHRTVMESKPNKSVVIISKATGQEPDEGNPKLENPVIVVTTLSDVTDMATDIFTSKQEQKNASLDQIKSSSQKVGESDWSKDTLKRKCIDDSGESTKKRNKAGHKLTSERQRAESCPPLRREHINILINYIKHPKECLNNNMFLLQIKMTRFPRIKRYSLAKQLERWASNLSRRKVFGKEILCLRNSKKVILPKGEYERIINDAHLGTGHFSWSKPTKDDQCRVTHNSYHKTLHLIDNDYGVGGREFGMSKYLIYETVANCQECPYKTKKLPSLSKLGFNSRTGIASNDSGDPYGKAMKQVLHCDADALNESRNIDLSNAPLSMIWGKPVPGTIWYNQEGLAAEKNHYAKLVGVIHELGLDMNATVQGQQSSADKLLTKIYCAERIIEELKETCAKEEKNIVNNHFMQDYAILQKKYLDIGRLDLFLYDVNLLSRKYNLGKNERFMKIVNDTVISFGKRNDENDDASIFDVPIELRPEDLPQTVQVSSDDNAETQLQLDKLPKASKIKTRTSEQKRDTFQFVTSGNLTKDLENTLKRILEKCELEKKLMVKEVALSSEHNTNDAGTLVNIASQIQTDNKTSSQAASKFVTNYITESKLIKAPADNEVIVGESLQNISTNAETFRVTIDSELKSTESNKFIDLTAIKSTSQNKSLKIKKDTIVKLDEIVKKHFLPNL